MNPRATNIEGGFPPRPRYHSGTIEDTGDDMARIEHIATIDCPPETLFDFLNAPSRRVELSPDHVRFQLLEAPEGFAEGSRYAFEVRAHGQRQKFVHEVTDWQRPVGFTETQVTGPFGAMQHVRRFEPDGAGTRLVEIVDFEPPGGLLGFLLTEARLRRMLSEGFEHQHRELQRLLGRAEANA